MTGGCQGLIEIPSCSLMGLNMVLTYKLPTLKERNRFPPNSNIQNLKIMWILNEWVINVDSGVETSTKKGYFGENN